MCNGEVVQSNKVLTCPFEGMVECKLLLLSINCIIILLGAALF